MDFADVEGNGQQNRPDLQADKTHGLDLTLFLRTINR